MNKITEKKSRVVEFVNTEVKSEWIGDGATKQKKNRGDKQEEKKFKQHMCGLMLRSIVVNM